MPKIINLEINEISPKLLINYINNCRNKNKTLTNLYRNKLLKIFTTKALDVEKEKLYPSQTWASFHTGKPFKEHKCYWYSDFLNKDYLIWNKLASRNKTVGIINCVHSSKFPENLFENENFKFYLPDCFGDKYISKPERYKNFNEFNNSLVGNSARVTGLFNIAKIIFKNLFFIMKDPRSYGVSIFSINSLIRIIFLAVKNKNKEFLRMAQFPLIGSIFLDLVKKNKPDYSAVFSNHVAGNMHRYWYAHDIGSFRDKTKYSNNWIKQNSEAVNISIDLFDDFLKMILKERELKDYTIFITSSMGQEANPTFDNKFLSKYDGKIDNMDIFLRYLTDYLRNKINHKFNFYIERNMAPQYGFNFQENRDLDLDLIAFLISNFVNEIGLKNKVDKVYNSIVLTLDPSKDENLQKKFNLKEANNAYSKYGLKFFPVEDHHSGSHTPEGLLAIINSFHSLEREINKEIDEENTINYLKFHNIILSSL